MAGPAQPERDEALKAGAFAARHGGNIDDCPYDAGGDDTHRALTLLWVRAFLANKPDQLEQVSFEE